MTTPRALALGAVVGFYLLELSFSEWVQFTTAVTILSFAYGYAITRIAQIR